MGLYARWLLPRLTDLAMRNRVARAERARLVPEARGRVLEVGIGSGLNLPFYSPEAVRRLWGLDPSREGWRLGRRRLRRVRFPAAFVQASAEQIPLRDAAVDTVVTTFTLCSVPDPAAALREMRRVLAPGGRLLFAEHGRAPEPRVARWQERLNPMWSRIAGGCTLDRRMDDLIREAGFRIERIEAGYARGPRLFAYLYRGLASPAP